MLTFSIGLILLFSLAGFLIFVWKNKSSIPVSPIHSFIRPTEVKISLKNICHNYLLLRKNTNKPIIAVIKAHAYGCGSLQVVTALEKEGCDWFAVAFLHEALVLRKAKIRSNLLILGYTDVNEITAAIKNDIVVTVYDENIAKKYSEKAVSLKKNLRVHVKVKTGMGRLGVFSHQAAPFFRTIKQLPNLSVEGIYTHLSKADELEGKDYTLHQIQHFTSVLSDLEKTNDRPKIVHCANSAAALYYPESWFDYIRPGISLYGINPSTARPLTKEFKPAIEWTSSISSIELFPKGHSISYGGDYITKESEWIGVIPVGYADGFQRVETSRINPAYVLVKGMRCPIVGRVTMDQTMIKIPEGGKSISIGEPVTIIGTQNIGTQYIGSQHEEQITVDMLASWWNTINYVVISGIRSRIPRFFIK